VGESGSYLDARRIVPCPTPRAWATPPPGTAWCSTGWRRPARRASLAGGRNSTPASTPAHERRQDCDVCDAGDRNRAHTAAHNPDGTPGRWGDLRRRRADCADALPRLQPQHRPLSASAVLATRSSSAGMAGECFLQLFGAAGFPYRAAGIDKIDEVGSRVPHFFVSSCARARGDAPRGAPAQTVDVSRPDSPAATAESFRASDIRPSDNGEADSGSGALPDAPTPVTGTAEDADRSPVERETTWRSFVPGRSARSERHLAVADAAGEGAWLGSDAGDGRGHGGFHRIGLACDAVLSHTSGQPGRFE